MSSISAVTFNSGSTIDGTIQVGQLAIGSTPQDYTNEPGGLRWWSSADLESGYIIAHVNTEGNQPNSQGIPGVKVGFWRTQFSDSDFISWAEYISITYHTPQTFSTATEANIWLFDNGYWTSYVNITVSPTPTITPTITPTPSSVQVTPTPTPSSTPVAPVSSGLELYYDPSNPSSYPGSGTILYDLSSSGVNATIGGSPTLIDNSFTFSGSQSIITGDLSGLYAGWQHSLEIWFNASAIGAVFSDTGTGPTNTSYHTTGLEVYSAGPFYLTNAMLWKAVVGGVTRVGGGTVGLNTWYQLVRVYNGSNTAYAYLNKVKSSDTSITWGTPTPGWYLNFGSSETTNFATGAAFQGKLGVVRLYNRVLSLSEVTQNFDAEKSKYGL